MTTLDRFLQQYIDTALWSSRDDDGKPLDDNYSSRDIDAESLAKMREECSRFIDQTYDLISDDIAQAGHDFWLTRNHHGAGFWDGDWGDDGDKLTTIAHSFGESDLCVGDDGILYVYPA